MLPAFSSLRSAGAFALMLVVLLALPALVAKTDWLDRRDVYPTIAWKYGPFPWIQQKIFFETNDVDIAFIGSSHIWCGVDTPHVQKKLSEQLGRPAEVFTLGWPWAGFDASYIVARDLLDHRHVRMLVIYDEDRQVTDCGTDMPHPHSSRWFRIGENSEALVGLSLTSKVRLYGNAVLGMPRHLLSALRPNLMADPAQIRGTFWDTRYHALNIVQQLGSLRCRMGFANNPHFIPRDSGSLVTPDVVVYSAATADRFVFTGPVTVPYQLHFARKLARLCRERGTRLVILHLPEFNERAKSKIPERECWPETLGAPVTLLGIPGTNLFAGIPPANVQDFFFNKTHLNQNGQDVFTPLITPTLLNLYAGSQKKH